MELHQLRYFVAVARLRNFSRAADRCHVSQPSLSQQIMKLEAELGERLLERTKRKVELTSAGALFLDHAVRVADEIELAREAVRDVRALVRGRVVLGALPTIAPYYLPARLHAFAERFPGIEVVVNEDTTAQLAQAVLDKEIDLALISLPVPGRGLLVEKLFEEELLVVIPADHRLAHRPRLSLADLKEDRFILMHQSHCLSGQALRFCHGQGMAPNVNFRSAQIETILAFVGSGHGVSLVPAMSRRRPPSPACSTSPSAAAPPSGRSGSSPAWTAPSAARRTPWSISSSPLPRPSKTVAGWRVW